MIKSAIVVLNQRTKKMETKNPIDILKKEHEKVLEILDKIEDEPASLDTNSLAKNIAILEK